MIGSLAEQNDLYDYAASVCGEPFVHREATGISVFPDDAAQASSILRFCDTHRLPVSFEGAGTKQSWLNGTPSSIRLRTNRVSAVMEHSWQDMTCTVQAGCTWKALQDTLGQHGQFVALDPLWPEQATVGGVVGANDSGALRLRYGGLRDLLIGMTVVLADGTIARSGGKVVKNVAGYDLPKLLCGSYGTLAFITEATFRLHSIPRSTATHTVTAGSAQPLGGLLLKVLDSTFSTQSMQLRNQAGRFALEIRLAAFPEVLAAQAAALASLVSGAGATLEAVESSPWTAREELFDPSSQAIHLKGSVLPTQTAEAVQRIADMGGTVVAQGTGLLTGRVPREAVAALMDFRAWIEASGGSLVLLNIPAGLTLDRWGGLPQALPLMRSIKHQFDPNGILNPRRFLGAI